MHWFQEYWESSSQEWESLVTDLQEATGYMIWNPGIYGAGWHAKRIALYPPTRGCLLGVGLNPGPYGMAQTGIPFTDIKRINECLPRLRHELQADGVQLKAPGLAPPTLWPYLKLRHEASSVRVYRFLSLAFGDAEAGLTQFVFANPCPLLFIESEVYENRTPADFATCIRKGHMDWDASRVHELLDRVTALRLRCISRAVEALDARGVILLGKDVQKAVQEDLCAMIGPKRVVAYPHPARAVPDIWSRNLLEQLQKQGLM